MVVTILCGTEYGFAKEISEKLYGRLRDTATFWCAFAAWLHVEPQQQI